MMKKIYVLIFIILFVSCKQESRLEYTYIDLNRDFPFHDEYIIDWVYCNFMLNGNDDSRFAYSFIIDKSNDIFEYMYDINKKTISSYSGNNAVISSNSAFIYKDSNVYDSLIKLNNSSFIYKHGGAGYSCSLNMALTRHPVLVGDSGKLLLWDSVMYYYSIPRMDVTGILQSEYYSGSVAGVSWMDRQWGNFILGYEAYSWFSIYLDNDVDIMAYKMNTSRETSIYVFEKDIFKSSLPLGVNTTDKGYVIPLSYIKSGEVIFPYGWRIFNKAKNIELMIIPDYNFYEMWECDSFHTYQGICSVEGIYGGEYVRGKSFMEFNGADYENTSNIKEYRESVFESDVNLLRSIMKKRVKQVEE